MVPGLAGRALPLQRRPCPPAEQRDGQVQPPGGVAAPVLLGGAGHAREHGGLLLGGVECHPHLLRQLELELREYGLVDESSEVGDFGPGQRLLAGLWERASSLGGSSWLGGSS